MYTLQHMYLFRSEDIIKINSNIVKKRSNVIQSESFTSQFLLSWDILQTKI